ncbi:MAG: hypothetical protein R6X19_02900 [Kiritimatiellia bacterium]
MKLPTDAKTRKQLLALGGVVALLILVAGYLGLTSLLTKKAESRIKLEAAREQLDKISQEIMALPALRKSRDVLFNSMEYASTHYVLFHEYRNYHLTVREMLLPIAAELNITVDIPKEGVVQNFPVPESKATNKVVTAGAKTVRAPAADTSAFFALYPVSITGRAGLVPLLAFIRRLESMNPYLTVSEISVQAQPETPAEHAFTLTVLWPIWKNLEQKPKREDLILPTNEIGHETETP